MDRITTQIKSIFPLTWDALSNAEEVGDSVLEARISYTEMLILGEEPDEIAQKDMNALVIEFVAKCAVLEILPAAIDYWKEQLISTVTTGTNEQDSWEGRLDALKELNKKLLMDIAKLEPIVEPLIPVIGERKSVGKPLLSSFEDDLLTPDPRDLGRPYAEPTGV